MGECGETGHGRESHKRRADAERNIEAILDAAIDQVSADADMNVAAIARAAGLSRVTLYTHFPSREALIEAAVHRVITGSSVMVRPTVPRGEAAPEMLAHFMTTSWQLLHRYVNFYAVASGAMSPSRLRAHHEPVLGRLARVIARGQQDGVFRADLPLSWLTGSSYTALHLAADEVLAGHLDPGLAGDAVTASVLALLTGGVTNRSQAAIRW